MKLYRRLLSLFLALVLTGLSGCLTLNDPYYVSFSSQAPDITYAEFIKVKDKVATETVIALIAYSSSDVQKSRIMLLNDFETLFNNEYANVMRSQKVGSNYNTAPTSEEIRLWRKFVCQWMDDAKLARVDVSTGKKAFANSSAAFIFKVIDSEYKRQ